MDFIKTGIIVVVFSITLLLCSIKDTTVKEMRIQVAISAFTFLFMMCLSQIFLK